MQRIAVLGLGRVGALAARMLAEGGFEVVGHDVRASEGLPVTTRVTDVTDRAALDTALADVDAVLSALPYHCNATVADVAVARGVHYFDLTEDVPTTSHIRALADDAPVLLAPQCGLAPGFVGIVGAAQAEPFERIRSIRLRVGALPQHPTGLMGYAFNWSPEGVVNEYLNDCEVIEDGVHKWVSPMEWHEIVHVDGTRLEAFTTSGGLGTMCETYLGRVENIDYKTMRYPGHMQLMNFLFHELLLRERRELAGELLVNAKPPVDEDVVYVHVAAEGTLDGHMRRREFVRAYRPREVAGVRATAIAWTTAAAVVGVVEMVRDGTLPQQGFLHQEHVPLDAFLATRTGSMYATGS